MLELENDGAGSRGVERAVGERNGAAAGRAAPAEVPDPELAAGPKRRRFSAEYKLAILREADACSRLGEIGALLRREGLYSSHLATWRKQRDAGSIKALSRPRGAKGGAPARARERRAAWAARAHRVRALQGAQGDRGPGKRLCALGATARDRGRERAREHRAMIEQTVQQLTPIIGTRPACRALGAAPATIYRRRRPPQPRPQRPRSVPARALTVRERCAVLDVLHCQRFVDCSPAAVWATLLDEGRYLASERTFYRLLAARHGGVRERRDQLVHPPYERPELLAERPNELWSWDVSKLKGPAKWTVFYLYVILDVFSRYAVGWTVAHRESAELAKALIAQAAEQQQITRGHLTVHADRGPAMRSKPVAFLLADLGVAKTHSRPYTSTDNPYSEAQVKTLKYRPEFPERFDSIEHARAFCRMFFDWYNHSHRHSGIGLMTPAAMHHGQAQALRAERQRVLAAAYAATPERFVRGVPKPPTLPSAAWINKPATEEVAH